MANNSYRSFKVKEKMSPKVMLSIAIVALGLLSLVFMAGTGIKFVFTNTYKGVSNTSLWVLTWGGVTPMSAGLIVAFFLTIVASLFAMGIGGFQYIAIISMLMFVAAGVLSFCTIPLCQAAIKTIGAGTPYLGWGAYVYGILNILCGVGCVLAVRGD